MAKIVIYLLWGLLLISNWNASAIMINDFPANDVFYYTLNVISTVLFFVVLSTEYMEYRRKK